MNRIATTLTAEDGVWNTVDKILSLYVRKLLIHRVPPGDGKSRKSHMENDDNVMELLLMH